MDRSGPFRWGLALAVVLVAQRTVAGEGTCRTGCHGTPQIFKYAEGTTYKYNYEGKIDFSLSSAEGQTTNTDVKATVLVTQQAECNLVLRLQNVQVSSGGGKKYGHIPDIEKPIRFNFQDGHIEDSICIDPKDTQNSINIKRAIASLFQVNFKNSYETDVFGVCPTDTAQHKDGNVLVIQKSRDLNKCAYREYLKQDFISTTFNLNSEIKSSPILNADYSAKLRVKNGILDQATVTENYLFTPFSVGKSGAKAQATTTLRLTGTSKDNPKTQCSQPRSIIFDNPHPVVSPTSNVNTIINAVKKVTDTIAYHVGAQTAKEFVSLVKAIRASKKDDLLTVYNQVKSGAGFGAAGKKAFLDALLEAGTGDAIEVALILLKNNELSDVDKKLVYLGLSLVRHATESSLNAATALLNMRDTPYEAYLGVGNLAGRYCRQHSCKNVDAVNKLTHKLIQKISGGKAANRKEENDKIFALKALANFHYVSDSAVQNIISIAQDKKAPNRLRIVALETYLADPCKDKLRDSALNILQDIQQDSEVRIKAYLAVAQCPNAKIGNAVKALLEKEPSYQVGGFINSHIRTIKASANPDKDLAKQYLGFSVSKKFPVDFRKWSYNGEFSYAIDTLGTAASAETNIIYSQDSFLPRSTSLNLTGEVFGQTFNFLEIRTRQENFDKLVEHYFGPKGLFRTSTFGELWKSKEEAGTKAYDYLKSKLESTLRARRDVSRAEIESIGKSVQIKENELNRDLDLDLSVKAFGSEILFSNLNVYHQEFTPEGIVDKLIDSFAKGLDKLKQFDETLRSNLLFLDVEFAYPTSLGFPLRLAVEGTSAIQVKAKGGVDVRALYSNKDSNINIQLIPSANIEVAGRLTLDALVVENGLKVASTLYSATGGDIAITLFNGHKGVDVKFNFPVQEQKLISGKHEIVFHTREQSGQEQNVPLTFTQPKVFSICIDQLSPFIGLEFCADLEGPSLAGENTPVLPFPFAGDAEVEVRVGNEDASEYHFKTVVNNEYTSAELVIEAIGKNKQRKAGIQVNAEMKPETYVKGVFTAPNISLAAEGRITNNNQEKSISVSFNHNTNVFLAKIGVAISGSADRAVYKPIIEYRTPWDTNLNFTVQGQIVVEKAGPKVTYKFDNVKLVFSDKIFSLQGSVGYEGTSFSSDLTVSNGQQSGSLKGLVKFDLQSFLVFNAQVENTINPHVNFHAKGELKKQTDQFDSSFQLIHGADLGSKINIITLSNSFIKKFKNSREFTLGTKNKFTYPLVGIDSKFDYVQTPKSIEYDLELQYNDIKFGSELEVEINGEEQGDFEVDFELYGLNNKVKFKANRQVKGEESKIKNELELNGDKLEVIGTIKHHIKPSNVDVGADLTVVIPSHNTPFKIDSGLIYNPNELDAHHKVTSGSTIVVDAFLKANKGGNVNGSIKVNIKNLLVVNGHVKATKGTGNGEVLIDALNIKKQVKIDSRFVIQAPSVFNVVLNIYPSFKQDKNLKVVISTDNKITETSVNTQNTLDLFGKILEVNVKGEKTGDARNGKLNGEFEITTPYGQYLLGKVNTDNKLHNDLYNGENQASLEYRRNKNASGQKISVKATYRDTNPNEGLYDVEYNVAADDSNGKNINADISVKSTKQGETRQLEIKNKVFGSIITNPLEVKLNITNKQGEGNYETESSYGPDAVLKVSGEYSLFGEGKPISGKVNVELSTPSKALKTLKISGAGSLLKPQSPSDYLELEGSSSLYADDGTAPIVDFKGDGAVKVSDKDGEIKGNLHYGKFNPIVAVAGYSRKESDEQKQLNGNLAVQYGQGKNFKLDGALSKTGDYQYALKAEVDTPAEEYKNTKVDVQLNRDQDNKHVTTSVKINSDGKVWNLESQFLASELTPVIDIKLKCPEGKLSQFYVKGNKVSDKEFGGELKIITQYQNFLLEGDLDANIDSVEQFYIKANVNSPNIKLNKVVVEVNNKPGKTGRKITVTIKSAGKNVVSGSTSYQAREDQGKYVVEGSGSFKVKEETQSANFKYICNRLTQIPNGEQGIEVTLNAAVGKRAIDGELKITNKQFRILNSYCEENKECANIEIDSKTNANALDAFNQELEISIDLRKLGLSHEFGLKSVTNRKDYVLDHTVDVHFQSQENSKYQYSVYLHPQKAGVSFTTPKRIIALEANAEVPQNFKNGGKISGEVAFYLDKKNQPNKKAAVTGWLVLDVQGYSVNGETKLLHPGLQRPLSASVKTSRTGTPIDGEITVTSEFDIFSQPSQKLVVTYHAVSSNKNTPFKTGSFTGSLVVKSQGLGIDIKALTETKIDKDQDDQYGYSGTYASKLSYRVGSSNYENELRIDGGKTRFNFLLKVLNVDLLKSTNTLEINKDIYTFKTVVSSYTNNDLRSTLEIKNFNTLKYTVGYQKTPNEKLEINSGLIPNQIADIRADHITGAGKINLFHATLKLDDANFCKPDYNINSKEIEKVLEKAKQRFVNYVNAIEGVGTQWTNDIKKEFTQLAELSKTAVPNLQPLKQYYTTELQKLKDEILSDKSVKELGEVLKSVFGAVAQSVTQIFTKVSEVIENVSQSFQRAFASVIESINKELFPQLKEVLDKLTAAAAQIAKTIIEIAAGYLATVSQLIEKYQPEIKQIAATFGELGQNVAKCIQKAYEQVRIILVEQWKVIYNEVKALPVFDSIRAQYEEFIQNGLGGWNADAIVHGVREIAATIKDVIPDMFRPEIEELIDVTAQYLEKKLLNQPVDDFAVLEKLIQVNFVLVKRLTSLISTPDYDIRKAQVPVPIDFLAKLPKLVAIKFSPIAHLLKEDTSEEIFAFVLSLLNNPRQWVAPFPLFAMVVQGQHIFTFDGKHLTFPGNCKYLLARDAVYGNFTIAGTYKKGLLIAITVADKTDSVTLKKGGEILVNNAPSDLPTRKPDLSVFRSYDIVTIKSTAGVTVDCTPDLQGCGVSISGFYHGQVKGLLGNGNNEPYDDFTIANGKIVASEGEFGNSYKIGSCQAVTVPDHAHAHENPACTKLFNWESSLRYCYPFVKTDNFKTACAHGLAAGVADTEVAIARAYVAACYLHNIPVRVPDNLVKCTNGDNPYDVGEKFSIKVPSKSADIVLLVDTVKANEQVYKELVQPLVQDIGKELHSKGINDVAIHLITYGGENQWPSHVTVNGKFTFQGKAPNIKFSESPRKEQLPDGILSAFKAYFETAESIIHDLKLAFGQNLEARTYTEALDYPFRVQAAKSIIVVSSKPCEVGKFYLLQKLRALFYKNNQITLNLITPFQGLNVKDVKKTKDVVGFNDEHVFTISQAKKKPEGTAELYKDLQYDDFCVDFTIKNRGNVFVTDNFVNGKADTKKQFVHIAAHNIVDQLTNIEEGLDCECKMSSPYSATNVCHEVYAKEKPTRKGVAKG